MAITTQDGLVAAIAAAVPFNFLKASLSSAAAGQLFSLWRATGIPLQASIPSTWATCTSSTTGAVGFTNPTNPALTYLANMTMQPANVGSLIVFDRLGERGGLSGTVTTAQTVNASIPANRGAAINGSNVEWYLEWYTDTGGTAVTATITYTNQNDTTGLTTTVSLAATTRAGRMMLITPAAGDYIKSIQSVTLSATTGTAGSFGVTACLRVAEIANGNIQYISSMDAINLGLPRVYDNACLMLASLCSTTSTGIVQGRLILAQG